MATRIDEERFRIDEQMTRLEQMILQNRKLVEETEKLRLEREYLPRDHTLKTLALGATLMAAAIVGTATIFAAILHH